MFSGRLQWIFCHNLLLLFFFDSHHRQVIRSFWLIPDIGALNLMLFAWIFATFWRSSLSWEERDVRSLRRHYFLPSCLLLCNTLPLTLFLLPLDLHNDNTYIQFKLLSTHFQGHVLVHSTEDDKFWSELDRCMVIAWLHGRITFDVNRAPFKIIEPQKP